MTSTYSVPHFSQGRIKVIGTLHDPVLSAPKLFDYRMMQAPDSNELPKRVQQDAEYEGVESRSSGVSLFRVCVSFFSLPANMPSHSIQEHET